MNRKLFLLVVPLAALLVTLGATSPTGVEGQTTGISFNTGSTGGSSGGGYVEEGTVIQIEDITEDKSASTHGYFSGSWQTLSGRHVVGALFHIVPWAYSGSADPHVTKRTHHESLYVEQGTEIDPLSGASLGTETTNTLVSVRGFATNTHSGSYVRIQTSDTGVIPSGRILAFWKRTITTVEYDNAPPYSNTTWDRFEVELVKLPCTDASIDTRKTYGQANAEGELPADPNAPLRHMNFGPWHWKGGLFVGNMPPNGKDASGTARIQIYPNGSAYESDYIFASLSLYDMGKPNITGVSGAVPVGVYIPQSTDPNLTTITSESNVTWANRWNIDPQEFNGGSNYHINPITHKTLTNGNTDDYVSFPLTRVHIKPAMALRAVVIAIEDEADYEGSTMWHYFASKEHHGIATSARTDWAPKVWLIRNAP